VGPCILGGRRSDRAGDAGAGAGGRTAGQIRTCDQAATVENKRRRFRGTPPPADFNLDTLPPTALLSAREVAAILRAAIG